VFSIILLFRGAVVRRHRRLLSARGLTTPATNGRAASSQLSRATRERPARLLALKTDAGERVIDELADELLPLLRKHREEAFRLGHAKPADFVFATLNVTERPPPST
jgi:hypothetical protein